VSFSNSPQSHFRFNHQLYSNHFHKIHHIQTIIRKAKQAMKLSRSPNPREKRANRLVIKRILLGLSMMAILPMWVIFKSLFHPGSYEDSTILTPLCCVCLAGILTLLASYVEWIKETNKANKCRECGKQLSGGNSCPRCATVQILVGAIPLVSTFVVKTDWKRNSSVDGFEWLRSPEFWLKLAANLVVMIVALFFATGPWKITCQECDMGDIDKAHCPSCGATEPWAG